RTRPRRRPARARMQGGRIGVASAPCLLPFQTAVPSLVSPPHSAKTRLLAQRYGRCRGNSRFRECFRAEEKAPDVGAICLERLADRARETPEWLADREDTVPKAPGRDRPGAGVGEWPVVGLRRVPA